MRCHHMVYEVVASELQGRAASTVSTTGRVQRSLRHWIPSLVGWVTCNADGSFRDVTGGAICGRVLHNHHGEWIVGFTRSIDIYYAIEAELRGIYECLKYAWELGVDRLRLESDCGRAIQALKDRKVRHDISIVHHIWDLLDKQWEAHLLVIRQDNNKVVDSLAHLAWDLSFGFHDFIDPSSSISSLVLVDVLG
ncbi:hypothetical protein V6N13_121346 [Hibiscus sabdariffa]|uniref:RNase H type-1 domain-containing protein n=1 Tax=Hibiscus sabdariffa TaxID=183260 RepID=A0ABR2PEG2_9ROSI